MGSLTSFALLLPTMAVCSDVLFSTVRAAVKEGVQMALRPDLLDQQEVGKTDSE